MVLPCDTAAPMIEPARIVGRSRGWVSGSDRSRGVSGQEDQKGVIVVVVVIEQEGVLEPA